MAVSHIVAEKGVQSGMEGWILGERDKFCEGDT